ncbi:7dbeae35-a3da-44ea-9ecd-ca6af702dbf4 [Thermothielavioides terrestris]|uniref:7dbeae35-a3da-44ea-9ecd-ca6af702dbf4 n=1 Tax=Thermothielavioides terrestris TaxID=2587410 RepID=A0A446B572_9PEZI|nr:7dbeae35-a3da-44ea-9ecd-ca6af702dbf4 [Thermothielavioides terrestris]
MPGVVASCKTYYFVQPGDSCWSIELAKGISDAQLHKWNTGINADCTNLWANAVSADDARADRRLQGLEEEPDDLVDAVDLLCRGILPPLSRSIFVEGQRAILPLN